MPAMEPLSHLIKYPLHVLNKEEIILFEAELFIRICDELKAIFKEQYHSYFCAMRFNSVKENSMLEKKFVQLIIKDIICSEEYNLQGIACYTDTHEEVVEEVMLGKNTNPSAKFLRRLIDLHRSVRRELYDNIIKKITIQYAAVA